MTHALRALSASSLVLFTLGCGGAWEGVFGGGGGSAGSGGTGGAGGQGGGQGGGGTGGAGGGGGGAQGGSGGVLPTCGDGVVDPGEECDGAQLAGFDCTDLGFSSPAGATCTPGCSLDSSGCGPTCDDGALEVGELCDGANNGGETCSSLGFAGGQLACAPGCAGFDTSGCTQCGDGTLQPPEACDGPNLGGATCTSLGLGIGNLSCTNACQLDTSGCLLSVCGNGAIDGNEQCDDGNLVGGDGCSSTCTIEGDTCAAAIPVSVGVNSSVLLAGSTVGGAAGVEPSGCNGAAGPSRVYAVTPQQAGFLTLTLPRPALAFDSVLSVRTSCADDQTEVRCADSFVQGTGGGEVIVFWADPAQTYFVYVDGWDVGDAGDYALEVGLWEGRTCNNPVQLRLWPGSQTPVTGPIDGTMTQSTGGNCGGGGQGFGGYDAVFRVQRGEAGLISATLDATFASVFYIRDQCSNTQLECQNNPGGSGEQINDVNYSSDQVDAFYWVDAEASISQGTFTLTFDPG